MLKSPDSSLKRGGPWASRSVLIRQETPLLSRGRFIQSGLQRLSELILLSGGWQSSRSRKCCPGDQGPERRSNVVFLSAKGPNAWQSARVSAARVNTADNYSISAAIWELLLRVCGNLRGPLRCCYLQMILSYSVKCVVYTHICAPTVTSVGQIRFSSESDIHLQAGFEESVFSGILIRESTGLRSDLCVCVCVHKLERILDPSQRVFFC